MGQPSSQSHLEHFHRPQRNPTPISSHSLLPPTPAALSKHSTTSWLYRFAYSQCPAFHALPLPQGPVFLSRIPVGGRRQRRHLQRTRGVDRNPLPQGHVPLFWPQVPCSPALGAGPFLGFCLLSSPRCRQRGVHVEGSFLFGELGSRLSPQLFLALSLRSALKARPSTETVRGDTRQPQGLFCLYSSL